MFPLSTELGPTNKPRCPECRNSLQNGIPDGNPELRRCASCKTVFGLDIEQLKSFNKKVNGNETILKF